MSEASIGLLLALNGLIIAITEMILVYKLENKRHIGIYLAAGAFLIGFSFLLLEISPVVIVALVSCIVITFGEMLLFPFINNFWVKRTTERNRGEYAALYTMSFSIAIVLAPTFSSQIATWYGFSVLWLINFIVCTIASIGFLLLKRKM